MQARYVICIFQFFHVPGRAAAQVPFHAPQVEPEPGMEGPWYWDKLCEGNCQLLNSSRSHIFVWISSPLFVFFHQFYYFQAVMMSSGDLVSQLCAQLRSRLKYALEVQGPGTNVFSIQPTTPPELGTPRPSFGQFGPIQIHELTWRPCHSQIQESWWTPKRYVGQKKYLIAILRHAPV